LISFLLELAACASEGSVWADLSFC